MLQPFLACIINTRNAKNLNENWLDYFELAKIID